MRLVARIAEEKQAFAFYSFLLKEGIKNIYESHADPETKEKLYYIWIEDEDQYEVALRWYEDFAEHPDDPKFKAPIIIKQPEPEPSPTPERKEQLRNSPIKRFKAPLTKWIIILCAVLYFLNGMQQASQAKRQQDPELTMLTPLMTTLMFDYPLTFQKLSAFIKTLPKEALKSQDAMTPSQQSEFLAIEQLPYWKGIYTFFEKWPNDGKILDAPMFEKIQKGEVWRFITPCLLHAGLLHILFNMLWLWLLGRPVEERAGKGRFLLVMIIIGIVSNTAQYLMSGPFFLGYSGIVCGLAGYIWMRQKMAPWEGYPIHRSTFVFLFVFVFLMVALQIVLFILNRFNIVDYPLVIANTAHIVGGITGIILARIPIFSKGV